MSSEKNNKNDKKTEKRSLYQFLDKEGFYIILFLCVCIVAVTAIWVSNQNQEDYIAQDPGDLIQEHYRPDVTLVEKDPADEEEAVQETSALNQEKPKKEETNLKEKTSKEPLEQPIVKEEDIKSTIAQLEAQSVASQVMMMPVAGKLGLPFADDRLVYHKTLDQWSTHKGIDLVAPEGAPVRAVLDGEVIEVLNDTIMGITITLKHDDELMTRYSNLSTDAMVKVGDKVKKGQTISGVGKTAAVKALEGPLLHFQVIRNGELVNPEIYLPKLGN